MTATRDLHQDDITAAAAVDGRPWLFLDVDGVVAPIRRLHRASGEPTASWSGGLDTRVPPGYRTWPDAVYGMYVPDRLAEWAELLDATFRVRWATSWQHTAPALVAVPAGLPAWPALTLGHRGDGRGRVARKAAAVGAVLAHDPGPFAWVDDHLDPAGRLPPALARLAATGLPHLLVRPALAVGLTQHHVDTLTAFADTPTTPARRLAGHGHGEGNRR